MLGVGHSISYNIFKEDLEYTASLFIDQTTDTLDPTPTSKTADCRLCDTLNVITKNLTVTLGSSLSQTLASLSTSRHFLQSMRGSVGKNPTQNWLPL
jgi:hypothetical protein